MGKLLLYSVPRFLQLHHSTYVFLPHGVSVRLKWVKMYKSTEKVFLEEKGEKPPPRCRILAWGQWTKVRGERDFRYIERWSFWSACDTVLTVPGLSFACITSSLSQKTLWYRYYFHHFMMWTLRLRKVTQLAQSHIAGEKKGWYSKPNLKSVFFAGQDSDDSSRTGGSEHGIRYSGPLWVWPVSRRSLNGSRKMPWTRWEEPLDTACRSNGLQTGTRVQWFSEEWFSIYHFPLSN